MVLDGSERVDTILGLAMPWDVISGVARRAWARNDNSLDTIIEFNKNNKETDHITLPYVADDKLVKDLVQKNYK
jgi:urocanate hydratase